MKKIYVSTTKEIPGNYHVPTMLTDGIMTMARMDGSKLETDADIGEYQNDEWDWWLEEIDPKEFARKILYAFMQDAPRPECRAMIEEFIDNRLERIL